MKYPILCATLIASLFLSLSAVATPLDDKVAALKKAIKAEVAARPSVKASAPPSAVYGNPAYANAGYIEAALDQLVAQIDNPNMGNNADMQITQILSAYSSDAVQKAGRDLIAEIRKERKEHAEAAAAEIQSLLKRVSDDINKAKKPEDLDDLLVDLQKYQNGRNGGYNPDNQALYQQVSSAFEFTKLWQNYLSHLATGQTQLVMNDLQNLSQNNYGVGIIPRSRILELLAELTNPGKEKNATGSEVPVSGAQNILKGIKTLDDMEPALQQLAPLRQMNDGPAQTAYNSLAPLVQTYNNVKAGLPTNVNLNFGYNNAAGISPALESQLLVFILQHYFDTYKGTPPAADEKPQAFVSRVTADAVSREDWPLLQKALTGQAYLNRNSSFGMYATSSASTSVDNLLIALNQESARQYALAVVSYQNALKVSDTTIPAKLIGDKLAAIQKDHPKEYEEGMQIVISPPAPRYYPGIPPGMPYRGMPGYPMTPPNSGLSIPGASTNQTAPAAPSTNAPPVK